MIKHLRVALPLILLLSINCLAQNGAEPKVQAYLESEMKAAQIPGVAVAVIRNGEIVLAKGYGYANVEHQVPVKPETIFQSGSMGKQFTATAVMLLMEDGKLALDDKITKYFPDSPETWRNITIRHLLTHTSGMADYPPDFDFRRDYTEDELYQRAKLVPLAFPAGEKWKYSNLGYMMLGILIHRVSGKFYGDFLQERVFKPLGMSSTRVISEADIIPNRAAGYHVNQNGQLVNQRWVSPSMNTTADGALYMNVYDMAKWDAALYTEKVLKRSSLEQMWTPVKLNNGQTYPYGFGWAIGEIKGHRYVQHAGAWQGFKAQIFRYVDDKLTVVLFANQSRANQTKLAQGVAALFNPDLAPPKR